MARMSIDDSVSRDPRITALADRLGIGRNEAVGILVTAVWPICYDQRTHLVSVRLVDTAAGRAGFAQDMVECELASMDRSGKVRIAGAKERIEYLDHKKRAGREGGLKSARSREKNSSTAPPVLKQGGSTPQAAGNPPVPDPVPDSASSSAPVPVPEERERVSSPSAPPPRPGKRKSGSPEYTDTELAAVAEVLGKLSDRTGRQYSGSKAHTALIVGRLRDGFTAWDLRRVIGYCAIELDWERDERMKPYLRPETLFGPKTVEKYIYAARAWEPAEGPPRDSESVPPPDSGETSKTPPRANQRPFRARQDQEPDNLLPFPFPDLTNGDLNQPCFEEPSWMTAGK